MVGLQPFSCSRDPFFPRYRHATGSSTPLSFCLAHLGVNGIRNRFPREEEQKKRVRSSRFEIDRVERVFLQMLQIQD